MKTTKKTLSRAESLILFLTEQEGETLTQEEKEEIILQDEDEEEITTPFGDYLVLTEEEAEEKTGDSIDNYIEECVLCELPERYRCYFDKEAFKSDIYMEGNERGNNLASYDSEEHEQGEFLIYRTN